MSTEEEHIILATAHQVGGSESPSRDDKYSHSLPPSSIDLWLMLGRWCCTVRKVKIKVVFGQDESIIYAFRRTKTLEKLFSAFHVRRLYIFPPLLETPLSNLD